MATIGTHQSLSRYFPSSIHSQTTQEKRSLTVGQRRPPTSHYRPFSQAHWEDALEVVPPPRPMQRSRRNSISLFMSFPNSPLREKVAKSKEEKGKGREREGPLRKLSSRALSNIDIDKEQTSHLRHGLTSKASLSSLNRVIDISPNRTLTENVVLRTEDTYVQKRVWHRIGSMTMHPYPNDAVYMQSYDPIMLENEKYTYILLRRLTSSIPTFSTSMDKPPSNVLDLGCGQGHWLLDASNHWPSAEFTGFDLVDILLPEAHEKSNVRLVRGNFVKYRLPFSDKTFDFVRMANLTLAVPHERWSFVVTEVRRVLKTGGQLELIDDQIHFPYGAFPVISPPPSPLLRDLQATSGTGHSRSTSRGTDSDSSSPTLRGSEIADSECTLIDEPGSKPRPESHFATMGCQRRSIAYLQKWATNCQVAKDVEEAFTGMLQKRLVHPSPNDFAPDLLRYTFGTGNVGNTRTYHIKLAPGSPTETPIFNSTENNAQPNKHARSDQDADGCPEEIDLAESMGSDEQSPTRTGFPLLHSAKAAGRLGISYSDLIVATASARRPAAQNIQPHRYSTTRGPLQSPGIIIAPSTFIPLTPTETDFHACKWIHTLLGCRPAIFDYVRSQVAETGERLVSDAELKDALWTYESFRRQRFHWPTDPEYDPESFATPCITNTRKLGLQRLIEGREEPIHIRTIQVYHATKTDMTSLASLLFNPHSNQ